jgi:YidC/Oxa1 family membrane protein insertase
VTEFLNSLLKGVLDFFFVYTGNYGAAIILLSLLVMIVTLPLNLKQMEFTRSMQLAAPETAALKKKFSKKEDKDKLNQATMELWKKYNINPAMGCLPLLIQFPILIAMFNMLREPGLFADNPMWLGLNLTLPSPEQTIFGLSLVYWILPILSVVTTYWQSKQTMQTNDQTSRTMLYVMPLFMGYITISFPTALALYWVSRNVFSIVQQELFSRYFRVRTTEEAGSDAVAAEHRKNRKDS